MYKVVILMTGALAISVNPLRTAALVMIWAVLAAGAAGAGHGSGGPVLFIPADDVKRLVEDGERVVFVDLSPEQEFRQGRLPGARSLPLVDLSRRYGDIPRAGRVVLYCACPMDDAQAAYQFLLDQGYRNVAVLEEGLAGWRRRGYQLER